MEGLVLTFMERLCCTLLVICAIIMVVTSLFRGDLFTLTLFGVLTVFAIIALVSSKKEDKQ